MKRSTLALLGLVYGLTACQPQPDREAAAAGAASAPAAVLNTELVAGTPAGDIEEWVTEIRAGLDTITTLLATDRPAAHRKVLGLYMNRQEFLEVYYGAGGRMVPTAGLATAVDTNEERFHELMRITELTPAAPDAEVTRALGELERQLEVVLTEAKATPHRIRSAADSVQGTQ